MESTTTTVRDKSFRSIWTMNFAIYFLSFVPIYAETGSALTSTCVGAVTMLVVNELLLGLREIRNTLEKIREELGK